MKKVLTAFLVIVAAGLLWSGALMSAPGGQSGARKHLNGKGYAVGEILVKFRQEAGEKARDRVRGKVGALGAREFRGLGIQHIRVSPGLSVEESLEELKGDPDIEFAEPNYARRLLWTPDDPSFSILWGMDIINAPMAWDIQNSCAPKIGVVDTGMVYTHEDLSGNYIGGYDFGDNDDIPYDISWHGTHVSGTVGAVGNNVTGVVGVCPTASLMALKIFNADGIAYVSDEVEAINYAISNGITLLNLSIGDPQYSFSEKAALISFGDSDGLAVISAGNSLQDSDVYPIYPAAYDLPNIISVAASNQTDGLALFSGPDPGSNYGFFTVDLAAPGKLILSTYPPNSYQYSSGTSMASPHVTGVAALVNTVFPELDNLGIKNQILGTVDEVTLLNGRVLTGGRLNAYSAIANLIPNSPADLIALDNSPGVSLAWTDNSSDEDAFRIERITASGYEVITNVPSGETTYTYPAGDPNDYYRVRAIKNIPDSSGTRQIRSMPTAAISPVLGELIPPAENVPAPYVTGGSGGGGCFIATAAYGSYISPELVALRTFRDEALGTSAAGRSLIRFYYRNSPPLADGIKHSPAMRALVRGALAPVVISLSHPGLSALAALLMAAALAVAGMIEKERQIPMIQRLKDRRGFTLIELMVVLAILGLLAAFVAPKLVGRTDEARQTSAKMQIGSFVSALKLFRNDNGFYPTTEQGLEALVSKPMVGREPKKYRASGYIDKIPMDPWGNPYVYISPGVQGDIDVISLGADGVEGGSEYDADITNWD